MCRHCRIKKSDVLSIILKYDADRELDITNNDDYDLMHFYNAIFSGGSIESVVKNSTFSFLYVKDENNDGDKIKRYEIKYEFVQQNDSLNIYDRVIKPFD